MVEKYNEYNTVFGVFFKENQSLCILEYIIKNKMEHFTVTNLLKSIPVARATTHEFVKHLYSKGYLIECSKGHYGIKYKLNESNKDISSLIQLYEVLKE